MGISITQLRANIYNIVDNIIKTGEPIDIERDGITLRITAVNLGKVKKIDKLISRKDVIVSLPEDYVHMDWSAASYDHFLLTKDEAIRQNYLKAIW